MLEKQPGHGPHHKQLLTIAVEAKAVGAALLLLTSQGVMFEIAAGPEVLPILGAKLRAAADRLSPPDPSPLWQRIQSPCPN